jgi:energy-coupling factor transporter ATP-binding protein EcfA2
MQSPPATSEPLLRTLAPLLRVLERELRARLGGPHRYPLPLIARGSLEGMANDLHRQAEALDMDRPLLVIMLMGGTGVGKSTLLNALAGASIAQASFTRPTTRDPVVYYHESVRPDRLDAALRHCRLVPHDREALAQKVIVDTPDLDSNDLANRAKLQALLPVADIVLYVGSQEKYHDRLGWDLFKEQRKRRAFAFVLNKWDRCLQAGASGLRPDEDLLNDLKAEGFETPLLFRTMAQAWLDHRAGATAAAARDGDRPAGLPADEQFAELLNWLEMGLTRLEVEAVKARGVGQLLNQLALGLEQVRPPDLMEEARQTQEAWSRVLAEEAAVFSDVLLSTLDPYQSEIEHHFSVEGQQRFRGFMAAYLRMTSRIRYASGTLRDRFRLVRGATSTPMEAPASWNLAAFAHECTRVAGERVLDKRGTALVHRLEVEADGHHFPLQLLSGPTREASRQDWHERYDRALIDALAAVERIATRPTGLRKLLQVTLVTAANTLPEIVFLGALLMLLYKYFDPLGKGYPVGLFDVFLPFVVTLIVIILLQALIGALLPLRWGPFRGEFRNQLVGRLEKELLAGYQSVPEDVAQGLLLEREQVDKLIAEVREIDGWLARRQQAASIAGLYGGE